MGANNSRVQKYLELSLEFLKDIDSVRVLEIIIDIFDEVRYSKMDRDVAEQRIMKVLYNIKNSETFDSMLEESDRKVLNSILGDLVNIECDSTKFYIGNKDFADISIEEFYYLLVEMKYLKEKEIQRKEEAAN